MLKKLLLILVGILAVLLLVPIFLSSKMKIAREIEIARSAAEVHRYLADLKQYPKWNPFSEEDPGSTTKVTGQGVGSVLTWKGEKTGEGFYSYRGAGADPVEN